MSKEWEDDNDNDDDFDINDDAEVDEHEIDLRPMGKGAVHRRRIELLKEKLEGL